MPLFGRFPIRRHRRLAVRLYAASVHQAFAHQELRLRISQPGRLLQVPYRFLIILFDLPALQIEGAQPGHGLGVARFCPGRQPGRRFVRPGREGGAQQRDQKQGSDMHGRMLFTESKIRKKREIRMLSLPFFRVRITPPLRGRTRCPRGASGPAPPPSGTRRCRPRGGYPPE